MTRQYSARAAVPAAVRAFRSRQECLRRRAAGGASCDVWRCRLVASGDLGRDDPLESFRQRRDRSGERVEGTLREGSVREPPQHQPRLRVRVDVHGHRDQEPFGYRSEKAAQLRPLVDAVLGVSNQNTSLARIAVRTADAERTPGLGFERGRKTCGTAPLGIGLTGGHRHQPGRPPLMSVSWRQQNSGIGAAGVAHSTDHHRWGISHTVMLAQPRGQGCHELRPASIRGCDGGCLTLPVWRPAIGPL